MEQQLRMRSPAGAGAMGSVGARALVGAWCLCCLGLLAWVLGGDATTGSAAALPLAVLAASGLAAGAGLAWWWQRRVAPALAAACALAERAAGGDLRAAQPGGDVLRRGALVQVEAVESLAQGGSIQVTQIQSAVIEENGVVGCGHGASSH